MGLRDLEEYYERLWALSRQTWLAGKGQPVRMRRGHPVPSEWCVTTVARCAAQADAAWEPLLDFMAELRQARARQFLYHPSSVHVSLLGCTQRTRDRREFTTHRLEAIQRVCAAVLQGDVQTALQLKGAGISGAQVFAQGFCVDPTWPRLRAELGDALTALGENPMTYPNPWPAHFNVMRFTGKDPREVARIVELIERNRNRPLGTISINRVELLITDFVLSPGGTEHLATFALRQGE